MLSLDQIKQFYPGSENLSERNMLREYLQYKILDCIFGSKYGEKFSFIGGTAIRMVYGSDRFSEDLDFDHFGVSQEDFDGLINGIKKSLEREGLEVNTRNVYQKALRSHFKIKNLLYNFNLSPHQDEKILIYIDTTQQTFSLQPELKIINKFGVFTEVRVNPVDVLLSQKIMALLKRKRMMGRDVYDIIHLASITSPNLSYLRQKSEIENFKDMKARIKKRIESYNLDELSRDVEPFVADSKKTERIRKFDQWLKVWVV